MSNKSIHAARLAIVKDLMCRYKSLDPGVGFRKDGMRVIFGGSGWIWCPACGNGKLEYSRSSWNGHIRAKCSTSNCLSWME